jgi:hypothetical protein
VKQLISAVFLFRQLFLMYSYIIIKRGNFPHLKRKVTFMAITIDPKDVPKLVTAAKAAFKKIDVDTEEGRKAVPKAIVAHKLSELGLYDAVLHKILHHGFMKEFAALKKVISDLK